MANTDTAVCPAHPFTLDVTRERPSSVTGSVWRAVLLSFVDLLTELGLSNNSVHQL
jgi:hypothetical protein